MYTFLNNSPIPGPLTLHNLRYWRVSIQVMESYSYNGMQQVLECQLSVTWNKDKLVHDHKYLWQVLALTLQIHNQTVHKYTHVSWKNQIIFGKHFSKKDFILQISRNNFQRLFHSFHNVLPYISDETYHLWNKYTKWLILPSFQITRIFTNIKLNTKYIIQNRFMSLFKTAIKPSFLCKCNYEFSWCIKKKQRIYEWCQNNP